MLTDGSIGIFDTKGGVYAQTAKERAERLAAYIAGSKNKELFGGIVIRDKGSWRYNDAKKYRYDPNDLGSWKFLDLASRADQLVSTGLRIVVVQSPGRI